MYPLQSTAEHPYYVKDKEWIIARNLEVNDILVTAKNEEMKIENIEITRNKKEKKLGYVEIYYKYL